MVDASAMVNGFMKTVYHDSPLMRNYLLRYV
jgi:hypothetical protein